MKKQVARFVVCGLVLAIAPSFHPAEAQVGSFSKDDLIELTALWNGVDTTQHGFIGTVVARRPRSATRKHEQEPHPSGDDSPWMLHLVLLSFFVELL